MNLTIYNGLNSQQIALNGLVDQNGAAVAGATITAVLSRGGTTLPNSTMTFTPVSGTPGNYKATLSGFDAPAGGAEMDVSGVNSGTPFNFTIFATIAKRSL
jgi:hypothetical protein